MGRARLPPSEQDSEVDGDVCQTDAASLAEREQENNYPELTLASPLTRLVPASQNGGRLVSSPLGPASQGAGLSREGWGQPKAPAHPSIVADPTGPSSQPKGLQA